MASVVSAPVDRPIDLDSEKLSFGTKLAYGSGDLGTAITAALRQFYLLFFLINVAGLTPGLAATVFLLNRVWDAFNDPIVGWLSDRTTTRWGRRRPWLLIGAVPFGVLFFLLWVVPPFGMTGKFIYYTIIALLLDTAYTVINVPYVALGPELTRDYDERTRLTSFRFAFALGGTLVSAIAHQLIVSQFGDIRTGYVVSGFIWTIISVIPCFIVFGVTRERPQSLTQRPQTSDQSIVQTVRTQLATVFSNRPYRFVVLLYLCSWLALQLVSTVLIFYVTDYIKRPDLQTIVLGAVLVPACLALPLWSWLSGRIGKRLTYIVGASIWLPMMIALYFVQPGQLTLLYTVAALAGMGVSVAYLIPWAMLADVIEIDELETGQRREGLYASFMVFLQKAGIGFSIFLVGRVLAETGYIQSEGGTLLEQPASAIQALRIFIGPIPAVILAASLIVAYFYPLTKEKHEEARAELKRRAEAAENNSTAQDAAAVLSASPTL